MTVLLSNLSLDEALLGEAQIPKTYSEEEILRLTLESLYMIKNLSNKLYLKEKFFTFKMHEGKYLQEHIDEFNKLCLDLENIQVEYDGEDKALLLLHSLPKSYETFVDIFKYGRETISLEDVVGSLNSKELQQKNKQWIMDSGCSFNMIPNKDWFESYTKIDDGQVLLGNNKPCTIVGIKTVRSKMHGGVERTLTEVRHSPKLKRNLISLGTLDHRNFSYKCVDGVLKFSKGLWL
ncbi:uncharacterized protein LOC133800209 [Humulus lupulus]|uniref:uncharacterized protein LOC133800209 n=1 Tax=Humulus lupulus TaxID=3486 RepID=UPI002B40E6BD|nr:uncharacterized protein LOC133800209 [Humulus lupulus]